MCGFLVQIGDVSNKFDFKSAYNSLSHRGPDFSSGCLENEKILVGHHRLAICDLTSHANQPFSLQDSDWEIVFNGQVYNFIELRNQFSLRCVTDSDTEVLLRLYLLLGEDFVNSLNGDFALVIYNRTTGAFFAARDRLGVKPLFFSEINGAWYFSSEAHALARLLNDFSLDETARYQFLTIRGYLGSRTQFKIVKSFPSAHYMNNGVLNRYWSLQNGKGGYNKGEVRELIIDAIECRIPKDVSSTVTLSGGIDSFIIGFFSRAESSWCVGMPFENEFLEASQAAAILNSTHQNVLVSPEDFLREHSDFIDKCLAPVGVANQILSQALFKNISKVNKVVLSGEGADELFMGYDRIYRWAHQNPKFDVKKFFELYRYSPFSEVEILQDSGLLDSSGTSLEIVEQFFMTEHLQILLNRLDLASMFSGVEARVPFTDYRLVELIYGSGHLNRISDSNSKILLREIYAEVFGSPKPPNQKIGFPVPYHQIFGSPLKIVNSPADWLQYSYAEFEYKIQKKSL